ncbi:MAG: CoA-binding protein [Dehalococcoidia bacterium]|nr:CoA-binding protein [Dehalococcoidia bacterium]
MDQDKFKEIDSIFHPGSIAVVGVSQHGRKSGNAYVTTLLEGGFKGNLYAVGSAGGDVSGVRIFPSLSSIPEPVDYVIVSIPKHQILDLLDECHTKRVKVVQIFSAGFSESGVEGRELESRLVQKARNLGIRIIGPNCIGIGSSAKKMRIMWRQMLPHELEAGKAAFLSQSGGNAGFFMELGLARGIRFGKLVSLGNGSDLDSVDFLEYLGADPETQIIGAYLEGMKYGRKFLQLIRDISPAKPIVVLKGGFTEAGARTTASHTASLGGSEAIWKAGLRQFGAINVNSIEELADTILALHHFPKIEGRRVAVICGVIGAGGAACVAASDACAREGLQLPVLSGKTITSLKSILPAAGSIFQNPVDLGAASAACPDIFAQAMKLVFADPNIDMVVVHLQASLVYHARGKDLLDNLSGIFMNLRRTQAKPLIVLSQSPLAADEDKEFEQVCCNAQIPTYPSFPRLAKAIANVIWYWNFLSRLEDERQ